MCFVVATVVVAIHSSGVNKAPIHILIHYVVDAKVSNHLLTFTEEVFFVWERVHLAVNPRLRHVVQLFKKIIY